ncbi:hypothetical protein [Parathalassolituus penaei]|uniref:Uncharacterized protein n=1 Tax=Parathalassolituus penaei TaxID=2997323 RepID=A0A9X3ITE7_9GAMM|nr:hypothetical protein [Parathalassolituus penaei]MCY0965829.1 hypothetical protein [Parathalassolituus penaei]
MSGPIRRLRAATKVPSPKATVQTIVANDGERLVDRVRLEFVSAKGVPPIEDVLYLEFDRHDVVSGDSVFLGVHWFADNPQDSIYEVKSVLLDANNKPLDGAEILQFSPESWDEWVCLTDQHLSELGSSEKIRRAIALLKDVSELD